MKIYRLSCWLLSCNSSRIGEYTDGIGDARTVSHPLRELLKFSTFIPSKSRRFPENLGAFLYDPTSTSLQE